MLKNYMTVAVRNLLANRLYAVINIVGLAVGLASCLLILLYVRHELSFDRHLPDADRVYQVHVRFDLPGRAPMLVATVPGPTMAALTKEFSEIESAVRLVTQQPVVARGADVFREYVVFADPTYFEVLDLPLVSGTRALADVSSVLIAESIALKYFGTGPAVGKVLPMTFGFGRREYRVAGVFKDLPSNTHLDLTILARLNPMDFQDMPWVLDSWASSNAALYVKLTPGADVRAIERALPNFERRNIPNVSFGGQDFATADFMTLSLMNVKDIHLHAPALGLFKASGDPRATAAFAAVAAMILLIACINFTNLATARGSQRAREVALRKVLGARRRQLVIQFLSESILMSALAFLLALALVAAALPTYNTLLERSLSLDFLGDGLVPAMAALILVVGLAAGLYPALYLSGFRPAHILKANKSAAAEGSGRLRAGLVVLQFAISIGLLICTAVIYAQTIYARSLDPGYARSGLIVVRSPSGFQYGAMRSSLRAEFAKLPGVTAVTMSGDVPTDSNNNNNLVEIPGKPSPDPLLLTYKAVDYDFFSTYRVPLLAGRYFDESYGGDDFSGTDSEKVARGGNIIVNRTALGRLGLASPQDAIGRQVRIGVGSPENGGSQATVTIVGVVADVFFGSVRKEIPPAFYQRDLDDLRHITVRTEGVPGAQMNAELERVWRTHVPDMPYRGEFMEALIDGQYQSEETEAKMFGAFSILAVVIGCLGLYGLAQFAADRRTREIGLRKVLGARVRDVVRLLVWDFSKPVFIANVIAWPVAWFVMRDWLDGFQKRIDLDPLLFAAAGFVALVVAWATVGGHALRVARGNPVRALRYE